MTDRPSVLVVDDEPSLANLYTEWIPDGWPVDVATGGREAIESVSADTDIVVLDRRMPGTSGETVLSHIRQQDIDCQVVVVTAVDPDFDIIELGIDEYLVKPVDPETLSETLYRLADRLAYDEQLQEYYALVSKVAVLEASKSRRELEASDRYQSLKDRTERKRAQVDTMLDDLSRRDEFEGLLTGLFGARSASAQ